MSEGWFTLHRGWRENDLFKGEFSRADAWVWLIENACWKPTRARIKGDTIELQRGEMSFSIRFLAEKWGWSKSRVDRFLADLREEMMIETRSKFGTNNERTPGHGQSVLTICNYAKYQDLSTKERDNSGTSSGTTAGQQRDKEEQGNKGTRLDSEANASVSTPGVDAPTQPDLLGSPLVNSEQPIDQAISVWKTIGGRCGWSIPTKLTPDRRKKLVARLRENGIDGWTSALTRAAKSKMLGHDPPQWWNFDFIIKNPENILKTLEGKYDDQFNNAGTSSNARRWIDPSKDIDAAARSLGFD